MEWNSRTAAKSCSMGIPYLTTLVGLGVYSYTVTKRLRGTKRPNRTEPRSKAQIK